MYLKNKIFNKQMDEDITSVLDIGIIEAEE